MHLSRGGLESRGRRERKAAAGQEQEEERNWARVRFEQCWREAAGPRRHTKPERGVVWSRGDDVMVCQFTGWPCQGTKGGKFMGKDKQRETDGKKKKMRARVCGKVSSLTNADGSRVWLVC